MKEFKVFYSWQSDIPKCRSFLQNCIAKAIKACNKEIEDVEIIPDRDTKDKTGSPNIPQTIFSKIDDCGLFIADVTIVANSENESSTRSFPNPNVLIELGYAAKTLGWDRVICFFNKDCGRIKDIPFDLRQHRLTGFKYDDSKTVESIIKDTIIKLSRQPILPKQGKSYHVVGTYDPDTKQIDADLVAFDITRYCWEKEYIDEHGMQAQSLIQEIQNIKLLPRKQPPKRTKAQKELQDMMSRLPGMSLSSMANMLDYDTPLPDRDIIKNLSKKYLGFSEEQIKVIFTEDFFKLGNMKIPQCRFIDPWERRSRNLGEEVHDGKEGTDDEKLKDKKIRELKKNLEAIQMLDEYLVSFKDILFFPLAIENTSTEADSNIKIKITVEGSRVVFVDDFINSEIIKDRAAKIYKSEFPMKIFRMAADGDISYENSMWYDSKYPYGYGSFEAASLMLSVEGITSRDYEAVMGKYIASPIYANNIDDNENKIISEYEFSIKSLHANEKKWLEGIIAVKKPPEGTASASITLKYSITSANTDGTVDGKREYKGQSR